MSRSLSVIIPNYNGEELLLRYLPHTIESCEQSKEVSDYEIIIPDDASTDRSIEILRCEFPEVRVISSESNSGFSKNINRGIRSASKELVLLLNNDMQISSEMLTTLIPLVGSDVFGVNCAIVSPETNDIQEGRKLLRKNRHKIHYTDDKGEYDAVETMYLCGGNALIDRSKLLELDGFDEIYSPFYFEDMDLSLRAWRRGWKSLYTSRTSCLHQHSATINANFSREYVKYVFVRNRVLLNYRFMPCIVPLVVNTLYHSLLEIIGSKEYKPYSEALRMILGRRQSRMSLSEQIIRELC